MPQQTTLTLTPLSQLTNVDPEKEPGIKKGKETCHLPVPAFF